VFPLDRSGLAGLFGLCLLTTAFLFTGCLPVGQADSGKLVRMAEEREKASDYAGAIDLYEKALDGTASTADVHFRLGLLYLDDANLPLSAAHHFERYLSFRPDGDLAEEARDYRGRAEREVLTRSGELGILTRDESARLKNENLALRRQLAARDGKGSGMTPLFDRARIYEVQSGDTYAVIARKVYGNPANWKTLEEANRSRVPDATKLRPGTQIIVPAL